MAAKGGRSAAGGAGTAGSIVRETFMPRLVPVRPLKVPLMGMINTFHEKVYTSRGHKFIAEFYADLDYRDDGSLIITREHEAKDPAHAAALCLRAIREGKVKGTGGGGASGSAL